MTPSREANMKLHPRPHDDCCWSFPLGLYGSKKNVNSFARRLAREGVRHGTWKDEFVQTEHQSVLEIPGDIFISDKSRWYGVNENVWRLNLLQIQMKNEAFRSGKSGVYESLVREMLDQLWFCVAMLSDRAWYGPCGFAGEGDELSWSRRVLMSVIDWLPEIYTLADRISNLTHVQVASTLPLIPAFRYQWADGIYTLCRELGHPVDVPCDIEDDQWDLVSELERIRVIATENGRCRLVL